VFGILGPNGSGKSTTLGMILDVINPTSGSYSWFGNLTKKENRQKIGAILETPSFYPYLSAERNLKIVARIKNYSNNNIDEILKTVGLYDRRKSHFHTFSLGMKQRLALASALLCDPKVLVLDEPTNGLDPKGIAEIREIIQQVAKQGKTVILASHLLDEVQKVCSHFAVLNFGELVYTGKVDEVSDDKLWVEVAATDMEKLKKLLGNFTGKAELKTENNIHIVLLNKETGVSDMSTYLQNQGIILTHLLARKKNLEQQFLDILNQSNNEQAIAN
jgi:ABC-2 type transport system ATP-binding protein